jgi:hypothetical protein
MSLTRPDLDGLMDVIHHTGIDLGGIVRLKAGGKIIETNEAHEAIVRPFSKALLGKEFRKVVWRPRDSTGNVYASKVYALKTVGSGRKPGWKCGQCTELANFTCGRCKKAFYCSRKCQAAAWSTHGTGCAPIGIGEDPVTYAVLVDDSGREVEVSGPALEGWALEYAQLSAKKYLATHLEDGREVLILNIGGRRK